MTPEKVALQFCDQKGSEFGITLATLDTCTNAVYNHLVALVNEQNKSAAATAQAAAPSAASQYRTVTVSEMDDYDPGMYLECASYCY